MDMLCSKVGGVVTDGTVVIGNNEARPLYLPAVVQILQYIYNMRCWVHTENTGETSNRKNGTSGTQYPLIWSTVEDVNRTNQRERTYYYYYYYIRLDYIVCLEGENYTILINV